MTDLKTAIKKTIFGSKKSVPQIADDLGCCDSLVYRYALDPPSGSEMPLSRLIPLMKSTDDYRILRHIAAHLGFAVVKLHRASRLKGKDPEVINEIQARFSRILSDFCRYTQDASAEETLELLDNIDQHLSDMASMRRSVRDYKQGDLF